MIKNCIVHVMANSFRTNNEFYSFIKENFNIKDHYFLIYNANHVKKASLSNATTEKQSYLCNDNITVIRTVSSFNEAIKILINSRQIIMHGYNSKIGFVLNTIPKLIKKTCIIPWGGDFFTYPYQKKDLKRCVGYIIKKTSLKRAKDIACIDYDEGDKLSSIYGIHRCFSVIHYYDCKEHAIVNSLRVNGERNKDEINIMLCNNAQETNMHIEALEKLLAYKDEPIKIHIFLSAGGTKEYIEKVSKQATAWFEDKAKIYTDLMSQKEYYSLISKMDVSVFSNLRLQGSFTSYALIYCGSKFFSRENNGTGDILQKEFKCKIYEYNDVGTIPFNDFISIDKSTVEYNRNQINNTAFSEDYAIESWKRIFSSEE